MKWAAVIAVIVGVAVAAAVAYSFTEVTRAGDCTHGESSVVFENGKQSEPVTSGCVP